MTRKRDMQGLERAGRAIDAREPDVLPRADVFAAPVRKGLDPAAIMTSVGEVPYVWSIDSDELSWGPNTAAVLMVDAASISSGRAFARLLPADAATNRFDTIMKSSRRDEGAGVPYQVQYALFPPAADKPLWIEDTGRWFVGAEGKPSQAHGVIRVVNERHDLEERLTFLSRFDALTGEMNRSALAETLEATIRGAIARRGSCGFLLVSIDNLGRINEWYGYDVADETIKAIAGRLRAKMRGGDHLGRFSGNKFGVILNDCTTEDMERAAGRLIASVRDDVIRTGSGPMGVTVTVGGVTAPRYAAALQEVLARAQEALTRARARRPGSFQAYYPNVEREALRRRNLRAADEIITALNQRRILLAFEPVAAAATRQIDFHECLMRVRRPDGSLAPASEVIPVAERFGLVRLLDRRVLELLVAEMAAVPTLRASINVAPVSTTDPDWWSALDALLRANPGTGERLIVEITESAAIHDLDDTRSFILRMKDLGCRIAIDDFGSGYTSFRSLRRLGVDILKIDGAFVRNLTQSGDDRAFAQMLIELARRLGLKTVAEWVQNEAAASLLAQWGCDYLQGALIGLASVERPWGVAVPVDRRRSPRA